MSPTVGRPALPVLLALALLSVLPLHAAEPAKAEETAEQLRQRLAERLKDDKPTLRLSSPETRPKEGKGGRSSKDSQARAPDGGPANGRLLNPKDNPRRAGSKAAVAAPPPPEPAWSYAGDNGPEQWAQLSPAYKQCGVGTRQSPIDIRDTIKVDQAPIRFEYRPSTFSVVDNGHTVQVNVSSGNAIEVMGRRFELVQFHFHRPSEERINGRQFDMAVHLVHRDSDKREAVIAVLLERGRDQALVQTIWNNLPLERGITLQAPEQIDLNDLLPPERGYFTYMGSRSTPPCKEDVLWMVFRQPVPLSAQQISVFSRLYPMNARPLQAGSGRLIKESN